MGRACDWNGGHKECVQNFGGETLGKVHLKDR
jgi:hypothetical protein